MKLIFDLFESVLFVAVLLGPDPALIAIAWALLSFIKTCYTFWSDWKTGGDTKSAGKPT